MSRFRAACVQNTATRDIATNVGWVCKRIDEAAAAGADFITLPETVGLIEPVNEQIPASTYRETEDIGLAAFRGRASKHGVTILVGSQLILEDGKIFNRSFLLDTTGEIRARYDKLHMFDIVLKHGESYRESDAIAPGDTAVIVETEWGKLGLSICYDLRFGALYRALAQGGAEFITIPAAFTQTTGQAHWHTLVRARAIETGAFIIAPNQCGHHCDKRYSYGHSLIVDPWGEILADGGAEPGLIYADIDLGQVQKVRDRIPSLKNERPFTLEQQ
ncbi:MAG: carbon-nitrogen hydrolase family protein [Gammaproteobacteria bacterium]|nr:carbon-nitrogen hydrolase family protein [Gammaproteobacteria bacterium]MDH3859695.1 carbon-nitrogen hydrolase family protein [Gammaproteobacteria bacterium]